MVAFSQKARDFQDAQRLAKTDPSPANRRRLEDARQALKESPEAAEARRHIGWQSSSQGSRKTWGR